MIIHHSTYIISTSAVSSLLIYLDFLLNSCCFCEPINHVWLLFAFHFSDDSLFHWGIGVGIMYMMSAGKAEINKLNVTVDETAKVVRELKSELYKRKYSRHVEAGKGRECNTIQPEIERSRAEIQRLSEARNYTVSMFDDGECESSVLTEEPDPEIHDMDQLEAELATELEKLPWCSAEDSCQAGALTGLEKVAVLSLNGKFRTFNQILMNG